MVKWGCAYFSLPLLLMWGRRLRGRLTIGAQARIEASLPQYEDKYGEDTGQDTHRRPE